MGCFFLKERQLRWIRNKFEFYEDRSHAGFSKHVDHVRCSSRPWSAGAIKVGGVADHVHLLTEFGRTITIAEFIKETKRVSNLWLKERGGEWEKFHWQSGYGVFSVSQSNVPQVEQYIVGQAEYHRRQTFQDEYRTFLEKHEIEYDERYVWD